LENPCTVMKRTTRPRQQNARRRTVTARLSDEQYADFVAAVEHLGLGRTRAAAIAIVRWSLANQP